MASASNFRDYALPFLGLQSTAHLQTNQSNALITAFNQALQEIFPAQFMERVSEQVRGPTSITLDAVTNGSKAITFSGYQSWMLGCTVSITGDAVQNEFALDGATVSLVQPYQGATQSNVAATVYQDCLNLSSLIERVDPPMLLNGQYSLEPLPSKRDLQKSRTIWRDNYNIVPKIIRRPEWYFLDDNLAYQQTPSIRILFDSLPDTNYVCSFETCPAPPRITGWDDTRTYFIPGQRDESILYPWALGKFLRWPQFITDAGLKSQIAADAATASQLWKNRRVGFSHTAIDVGSY